MGKNFPYAAFLVNATALKTLRLFSTDFKGWNFSPKGRKLTPRTS
jgi:hypothetical protein